MKKNLLPIFIAFTTLSMNAQTLVKDIRTGGAGSGIANLTTVNGTIYMIANDGTNGNELWKSDGTTAGSVLVKNLKPGSGNAGNAFLYYLTGSNGKLFFSGFELSEQELYVSDGTSAGTVMVKDINPTSSSGPKYLTDVNNVVFFSANDGTNGTELWKSDGTSAGTVMVKDINPGSGNSSPSNLININGTLFFRTTGNDLWKSDGTSAGTVLVAAGVAFSYFTIMNNTLYFQGVDTELWKSDGTTVGTVLVKDVYAGGSNYGNAMFLTNVNGTLFFAAATNIGGIATGIELWKSDGTNAGTELVKDILPGAAGSNPADFFAVNGTLYFSATEATNGRELWKSDGTTAGTVLVKDINPGTTGSIPLTPGSNYYFTSINNTLFFSATDGVNGQELWQSDGTIAGTVMISNANAGAGDFKPLWFAKMNNVICFSGEETTNGLELWKYDPSGSVGITSVSDNSSVSVYPNPSNGIFQITNEKLHFENVEIYNALGEKIYASRINVSNALIDISNQPKGIYFLMLSNGTTIITNKIVVD